MVNPGTAPQFWAYEARWTTNKEHYVIVPVRFPDGRLFCDVYTRDGGYDTLPDDELHTQVVAEMLGAGVEVIDADAWAERGRKLNQHEGLWTSEKQAFVIVTDRDASLSPQAEIRTLSGEAYPVEAAIRVEVLRRMVAAGVRMADPENLPALLTELRTEREALKKRERRLYGGCLPNARIPRAWLRHRINVTELEDAETPSPGEEPSTDLGLDYFTGRLNSRQIRATYPEFMARRQPGDELWWFKNPQRCWRALAGRAGYCLVRPRQPIVDFVVAVLS